MTAQGGDLADSILDKRRGIEEQHTSTVRLRVAVLGPGFSNPDDSASEKRLQIRDSLRLDGHDPFFPEDLVDTQSNVPFLEQERLLLEEPDVHLVIILDSSAGPLAELAGFESVREIVSKTAVLCPFDYYDVDDSLPTNVVQSYHVRWRYTVEELEACTVVAECRKWAYNVQAGSWSGLGFQKF